MATIDNAFLALGPASNNQVAVTVVCQLTIPSSDLVHSYRLDCTIFGNDFLKDDFLFNFESQLFRGGDAGASRRFEKTVSRSVLDEDLVGRDEVIGKLTLRNLTANTVVKKNTSVVEVVQ